MRPDATADNNPMTYDDLWVEIACAVEHRFPPRVRVTHPTALFPNAPREEAAVDRGNVWRGFRPLMRRDGR